MNSVGNYNKTFDDEDIQAEKLMATAKGYAVPHTILGKVTWIAYRVWNAVKSIFGSSDWQVQKQTLVNVYYSYKETEGLKSVKQYIRPLAESFAEGVLNLLVDNSESDDMEDKLKKYDTVANQAISLLVQLRTGHANFEVKRDVVLI